MSSAWWSRSPVTFSRALLEFSSDTITNSLSNIGYAFAKVIPTTNRAEQTVAINMQVVPGPRVGAPHPVPWQYPHLR